jgi:hypothetical protein
MFSADVLVAVSLNDLGEGSVVRVVARRSTRHDHHSRVDPQIGDVPSEIRLPGELSRLWRPDRDRDRATLALVGTPDAVSGFEREREAVGAQRSITCLTRTSEIFEHTPVSAPKPHQPAPRARWK